MSTNQELVGQIYDEAKKLLVNGKVDPAGLLSLTAKIMELVERSPGLQGFEKKQVVIEVVKKLVDETDLSEEDNAKVDVIIETTLPMAIDVIVSASRGAFNLNNLRTKLRKLCACTSSN